MRTHGMPLDTPLDDVWKVLVVDTSIEQAEHVARTLNDSGHFNVHTAANEFEAGTLCQQLNPNAIVLEVGKNPEEAIAICKRIKSMASLASIKILAATISATEELIEQLSRAGFDGHVSKPYSAMAMTRAIEGVLAD